MKKRVTRIFSMLLIFILLLSVLAGCGQKSGDAPDKVPSQTETETQPDAGDTGSEEGRTYKIGVVAGESSSPWYIRSAEGAETFMKERGIEVFQKAPTSVDAAEQVQVVEDVIAQGIDALCIIPIAPEALEPVLQKARENGIIVIAHEGSTLKNIDYDVEAFTPEGYGAF